MKLPEIDLKELDKIKEEILKERLEFNKKYVEWLKKTPNKKWSKQQRDLIDWFFNNINSLLSKKVI